jgi:hypothetical protein
MKETESTFGRLRMRLLCGCLLSFLLFFAVPLLAAETPESVFEPTEAYTSRKIEGWSVLVHKSLLKEHAEAGDRVLKLLGHQLYQIERRLPAGAVGKLRKVRIWVEYRESHHPCMVYHPGADWLRRNGMNPDKAGCVEVANADNFLTWTTSQPWMVLHELAHAYHDQFLPKGYNNADIATAYRQAVAAKKYESVLHIDGKKRRHYALTNPMEYFAEATEAYFGTNDFSPFVRSELAEHDPVAFELLGKLWGDRPAKPEKDR